MKDLYQLGERMVGHKMTGFIFSAFTELNAINDTVQSRDSAKFNQIYSIRIGLPLALSYIAICQSAESATNLYEKLQQVVSNPRDQNIVKEAGESIRDFVDSLQKLSTMDSENTDLRERERA